MQGVETCCESYVLPLSMFGFLCCLSLENEFTVRSLSFKLNMACIAMSSGVTVFTLQFMECDTVTLHVFDPPCLFVLPCLSESAMNRLCLFLSNAHVASAITWTRWFLWTTTAHIKWDAWSLQFKARSQELYRNRILPSFIPLFLCLPLTHFQSQNAQHPVSLPSAITWCASVSYVID